MGTINHQPIEPIYDAIDSGQLEVVSEIKKNIIDIIGKGETVLLEYRIENSDPEIACQFNTIDDVENWFNDNINKKSIDLGNG